MPQAITIREAMADLSPRMHGPAPDRYRASAEWWRLHATESAHPSQALQYADAQDKLAADMEENPTPYRHKAPGITDYEVFMRRHDDGPSPIRTEEKTDD